MSILRVSGKEVTVEKVVVEKVTKVVKRFVLDMSEAEAATLFVLTGRIGGRPGNSPRGFTDSMRQQLSKHIDGELVGNIARCLDGSGSIYFRDNSWDMTKKDD